jgi:NADPH:quinone reductase-like Zn-dependent oxidoreductase
MRHRRAEVIAGQTVLLQGTGGVSIFGLQLPRLQVVITSSTAEKLARAKNLGANKGINYKSTPDWEKAAMEFTGGRGVDQVVEVGGAGTGTALPPTAGPRTRSRSASSRGAQQQDSG